jgi:5-methylcytosine-specific restriction endonuclease McrA
MSKWQTLERKSPDIKIQIDTKKKHTRDPDPLLVELWNLQGGRCLVCNRKMLSPPRRGKGFHPPQTDLTPTIEHIVPKSIGGARVTAASAAALCKACNHIKGQAMIPLELWAQPVELA